ncbi:MAG: molybdopterin-dependent oxidoreductase, partial [Magnetococcales bacterium]|nr:molybdopterin-dependent oxidoreductase [Magnetococcales bacterium]
TRRSFLQTSGLAATGAAMITPLEWFSTAEAARQPDLPVTEEKVFTICNFCSSLCNVIAITRTEGGVKRVVKLEGNPHSTLNRGKLCARGQSGLRQVYDVDRIKTPLIRVEGSKRGEANFRAASWEEAWEYIAQKNKEKKIQPWEWTMVGGWTSCVFYMYWAVPFAVGNAIPNIVASPMQHCVASGHLGTDSVTGNFNIHDEVLPDFDNANYILFVANNASIGAVSTSRMVRFAEAKRKGVKVVALDSRLSETASKADEWIAIRPGTDLDFMIALMHVMLRERLYDHDFICNYTNMPFLVYRGEDGQWQLAMDDEQHPLVVERGTRQIVALPAYTNHNTLDKDGGAVSPELLPPDGMLVQGKPVMTVLQAQMAEIRDNTPAWAAKSTGISAVTIERIAREFAHAGRPIIDPGWHGARYGNINMLRRVQAMVQALVGGIDREGGWIMAGEYHHKIASWHKAKSEGKAMAGPLMTSMAGIPFVGELIKALSNPETFPHKHPAWGFVFAAQERAAGRLNVAVPALADVGLIESVQGKILYNGEPYRTRAILINAANPVRHYYPDTSWKEILTHENMELVIAVDVLPSDTIPYVDVVLPNPTYLERDEPTLYGNGVNHDLAVVTRYAALDPLYDTVETPDILLKLSEIISGSTEPFLGALEMMSGVPAKQTMEYYKKHVQAKHNSPYTRACREVSFELTAQKMHTTPAKLDEALRLRGVLLEEKKEDLLEKYAMPRKMAMPTTSGRLEFFGTLFQWMQSMGGTGPSFNVLAAPMAVTCRPNASMADALGGNEFYFTYGKAPTVSYGSTNSNNPVIAAINRFKKAIYTGVWIHPHRAEKLGIRTGDPIRITNNLSQQQATGTAYVTHQIHQDALFLYSSFGVENKALRLSHGLGTATNKLIPYLVEPVVGGFRSQEFTVRVEKI